jgi:hypothetical protein
MASKPRWISEHMAYMLKNHQSGDLSVGNGGFNHNKLGFYEYVDV